MESKIIKAAAIIALLVILISLIWGLGKEDKPASKPQNVRTEDTQSQDDSDKKEGIRVAESFVSTYNTYRIGDVSNITALYPVMCSSLAASEKTKAEDLKVRYANYAKYVSAESQVTKSEVESYDEEKIVVIVTNQKTSLEGATIADRSGEELVYKLLDKNGNEYRGNKSDLVRGVATETYRVTGIKESSQWKICELQKIN